jgi:branched-chain amino acid transport system ATP-binding protein
VSLLEIEGVDAGYETGQVLFDVDLDVEDGEVVSLLGRNGAGKSTTLRSIVGADLPRVHSGSIRYDGQDLLELESHEIAHLGISFVPEERGLFPRLTVRENIHLAATTAADAEPEEDMYDLFPDLDDIRDRAAANLSGGEQQMLAVARALVANPDLLLLDEPFEGLAPLIVERVVEAIEEINNERNVTLLLVEQNVAAAATVSDRNYLIDEGQIVAEVSTERLREDTELRQDYLGL